MEKKQILFIRRISAAGLLGLLAFVLVFGAGGGLFTGIVNDMNHNIIDVSDAGASIYNLFFYKGLGVPYLVFFSVSLFATVTAGVSVLTRFGSAAALSKAACISDMITGFYILLTVLLEKNQGLHRFIAGFYMDDVSGEIQTARLIGGWAAAAGVLLILLGVVCLLVLRFSGMEALKNQQGEKWPGSWVLFAPALYGSLFLEIGRDVLMGGRIHSMGGNAVQAYTYVKDYYFADAWGLNLPYVWYVAAAAVIFILLRAAFAKNKMIPLLITGGTGLLLAARYLIYLWNPPRLFGYLTLDEAVCDVTESLYPMALLLFILDILFLVSVTTLLLSGRCVFKKILLLGAVHAGSSVIAVFAASFFGITALYGTCAAVSFLALIGSFYLADIGGSHH